MKNNFCLLFLFCLSGWVSAQERIDTIELQVAEVSANRSEAFGLGQEVRKYDAEMLAVFQANGLDELLATSSSLFIKSYGAGSLASPASRGTGYGHTAVLWNGFNLQSPLNGGIDFSLLPVDLLDEVQWQQGGSAALFGSGAIGGVVHLQQKPGTRPGFHGDLRLHAGSFGQIGQRLKLQIGKRKWSGQMRLLHDQAKNDFSFGAGEPPARQVNAALEQWALTQSHQWQIADNQLLQAWTWLQLTDREIPPNRFQSNSHAQQRDTSIRIGAEWQRYGKSTKQKARSAWLDERFEYDSDLQAPSFTRSKSSITELENEWNFSEKQSLFTGLNFTHEIGIAPKIFTAPASRNRLALFMGYRQALAQWTLALNLRKEWIFANAAPFTGSLAFTSPQWLGFQLEGHFSRNYKLPTFNDLYWAGTGAVGNLNLKPEESWNQDLALSFRVPLKKHQWNNRLSAFNILVNDWILWVPNSSGIWQPDNLRQVWSRGVEASSQLQLTMLSWKMSTQVIYQWNRATNEQTYAGAASILGKQLIHVPMHTLRAQWQLERGHSSLSYRHQYTGGRFSSSDNEEMLAPFQLGDLVLAHRFTFGKKSLVAQFRIENLWNADYEVLRFRPMPGRGFWANLTFGF